MDSNTRLLERLQIVPAFPPSNLGVARTGDVVSLKDYGRCLIVFHGGIGTAGEDPVITVLQGTDVAFGTNKPLLFDTVYVKMDATHLSDTGQWTKVTQAAADTYTDTTSAEQEKIWAIEFKAEDLDIANGYDCIRVSFADAGSTNQTASCMYILGDPRYSGAVEDMKSAIID